VKIIPLLLIVAAAASIAACGDKVKKGHPGCPGRSARSSTDQNACRCGDGQVMWAGALACEDCDPTGSDGAYCDCGQNQVFSFNGKLDEALQITSPPVYCAPADVCPDGSFVGTDGTCTPCTAYDCGVCGLCSVGDTCISGHCYPAAACRVHSIPVTTSECEFAKDDQCGFGYLADHPVGSSCYCADSLGCQYEGTSEALSQ
jgi:hypothetical protein